MIDLLPILSLCVNLNLFISSLHRLVQLKILAVEAKQNSRFNHTVSNMVSKHWQKQHSFTQHACLFAIFGGSLLLFQLNWPVWLRLSFVALLFIVGIKLAVILNNYYASRMVRVFKFEYNPAVRVVQKVFRANDIWFKRQTDGDLVTYKLRDQGMVLTIEAFPLNLPIDQHIAVVEATKVELTGLNSENEAFVEMLTKAIDEMADVFAKAETGAKHSLIQQKPVTL